MDNGRQLPPQYKLLKFIVPTFTISFDPSPSIPFPFPTSSKIQILFVNFFGYLIKMQLSNSEPVWYFVFGPKQKSSLASQYALEHGLQHLINPSQTTLRQHEKKGLLIQGSSDLFYAVEKWKNEITAVFLSGELSEQEKAIKRDYQMIGRARDVVEHTYAAFRKAIYPQLIIVYGPSQVLITSLLRNYFNFIGFHHINAPLNANQILALPKTTNYLLTSFTPILSQVSILQTYFYLQIVHLRHNRTQLTERQAWFDQEATLIPLLQKRSHYRAVTGCVNDIIEQVGRSLLPELVYANVHQSNQRELVRKYVDSSDGLLLNIFQIQNVLRRKPNKESAERDKVQILVQILFQNIRRNEVVLTDFPWSPQEFVQLQTHTRRLRLFADCVRADHYQISKNLNAPIYFIQTLRRKQIDAELPFDSQVRSPTKYLLITGAACAGKTSAAKFIASELGYRHIEYQPYLATIKEKLIAPQDGEELPFRKIIAHFATLVSNSGNTPIIIDGLPLEAKQVENWTKSVGPAIVLNLKVDERELIRRTRKKAEGDLNAEVGEEELAKTKESLAKNAEWSDTFSTKSPLSTLYQIDFSQQLILAEQLLRDILRPRVYLIQDNPSLLYQNLSIRHNFAFFNLYKFSIQQVANVVRKGTFRDVVICNYRQDQQDLICKDFYWIEKNIGQIRYLSVWGPEDAESHDETLHLEKPVVAEKPKAAEGEEGEAPPPAEEQGEAKKKVFNIYDHNWTKPGNQKNLSQWFFKQKRNPAVHEHSQADLSSKGLAFVVEHLSAGRDHHVYHRITA